MPRASDSGDPGHASRNGVPDTAFRTENGVGIAMRSISELNPHGLLTRCVRFAPASHPANGNTRFRSARYGFDRAGITPAGLHQEVSLTHRSSSSREQARRRVGQLFPMYRLFRVTWQTTTNPASRFLLPL